MLAAAPIPSAAETDSGNASQPEIAVAITTTPRDTTASFGPQAVRQRLPRPTDIDEIVLPLTARN